MHFDEKPEAPFYKQIFEHFRSGIEKGVYPSGSKLPSVRGLASDLACSRNTVESAYQLLVQEGYTASRPGSGYIVQDISTLHATPADDASPASADSDAQRSHSRHATRFDFTYGNLQRGTFPAASWRTITDDVLLGVECEQANVYPDPRGEMELRCEITRQLNASRSIDVSPEQVVVQCGTEASVQNLLALFDHHRDTILMEDPGYNAIRYAFVRSGFEVEPCCVNHGTKRYLEALEKSSAKLAYVTPSSQFPTCRIMQLEVRKRLLDWAQQHGSYILEDDYCREFRYKERPVPPLAAMDDTDRVIYMGTFSKALSPALRINYLVLPKMLLARWKETFSHARSAVPWISQIVLARFMRSGMWDHHLRRLQIANRRKYEATASALRKHMGERIVLHENGTGLHFLIDVNDDRSQTDLIEAAAAAGVAVYGTQDYCMTDQPDMKSCILIGFSAIEEADIEPGIEALSKAWFG